MTFAIVPTGTSGVRGIMALPAQTLIIVPAGAPMMMTSSIPFAEGRANDDYKFRFWPQPDGSVRINHVTTGFWLRELSDGGIVLTNASAGVVPNDPSGLFQLSC